MISIYLLHISMYIVLSVECFFHLKQNKEIKKKKTENVTCTCALRTAHKHYEYKPKTK